MWGKEYLYEQLSVGIHGSYSDAVLSLGTPHAQDYLTIHLKYYGLTILPPQSILCYKQPSSYELCRLKGQKQISERINLGAE